MLNEIFNLFFKEVLPELANAGKDFIRENPKVTIAAGIMAYAAYQKGCNDKTTSELEERKMECRELREKLLEILLQNRELLEEYIKKLMQDREFREEIIQIIGQERSASSMQVNQLPITVGNK